MSRERELTILCKSADCEFGVSFPLEDLETTGFTAGSEQISESEAP